MSKRRILITTALPYANGPVHIGHILEEIQADIWARFQKMMGHECYFFCGDDTHGTPVMIEAKKRGLKPEEWIKQNHVEHERDLRGFLIDFDLYSSTHTEENRKLCEEFWSKMNKKNLVKTKVIDQLYCEFDKMFLPDRFVKGTCPNCGATDQYGDSCDKCGATYTTADLKNPYCVLCKNPPVIKPSEHYLFELEKMRSYLENWLPEHTQKEVANKMKEWFKEPLRDWDISRDEPYFGFKIPGSQNKYFYVWVDAPVGYMAISQQYFKKNGISFDDFWKDEKKTEVYHFIGKDISYFHTLFWPALLHTADFRSPTKVFVHGWVTVGGDKMSKSKGMQLNVSTYLKHITPEYLRYYFASKLSNGTDDLELNLEEFAQKVNAELIGKITNLASRGATMINKNFNSQLSSYDSEGLEIIKQVRAAGHKIAASFESREYVKAISEIREQSENVNRYFDAKAPWKLLAENPSETQKVLTTTLNAFRILAVYLTPVLPDYSKKVSKLLNESAYAWKDTEKDLTNYKINTYEHLMTRLDPKQVQQVVDESAAAKPSSAAPVESKDKSMTNEITIDDFSKIDLRIAKIVEASEVIEADKLLRLKIDLGELGTKQIFAGIKAAYKAEDLVGRLTVVVANLKPRQMKFGMSEGMVLAAGGGGKELFILSPDSGAKPGDKVK